MTSSARSVRFAPELEPGVRDVYESVIVHVRSGLTATTMRRPGLKGPMATVATPVVAPGVAAGVAVTVPVA